MSTENTEREERFFTTEDAARKTATKSETRPFREGEAPAEPKRVRTIFQRLGVTSPSRRIQRLGISALGISTWGNVHKKQEMDG